MAHLFLQAQEEIRWQEFAFATRQSKPGCVQRPSVRTPSRHLDAEQENPAVAVFVQALPEANTDEQFPRFIAFCRMADASQGACKVKNVLNEGRKMARGERHYTPGHLPAESSPSTQLDGEHKSPPGTACVCVHDSPDGNSEEQSPMSAAF